MALRVFYFGIAIFSVAMVILAVQTPYFGDFFKEELDIASLEMEKIIDYEVTPAKITSKYEAKKGVRYSNKDEFINFVGHTIDDDVNHTMSSNIAVLQGDEVWFIDDARYSSSDAFNYISDEIVYNRVTKIVTSNKPFTLWQYENNVTGLTIKHDLKTKQTFATGVHGWYNLQEK
ncbi:MAG: LPS export ABC transporter periplasmic protein LptC [Campylobacteraceae bacterium]|nr:LPS export ABC transporter periplasmic protein LptC [Campylobacteraceae bacterium]